MKKDFVFTGFFNMSPLLVARLYNCPELKEVYLEKYEGTWECPKCHFVICNIGKPKKCDKCGRKGE